MVQRDTETRANLVTCDHSKWDLPVADRNKIWRTPCIGIGIFQQQDKKHLQLCACKCHLLRPACQPVPSSTTPNGNCSAMPTSPQGESLRLSDLACKARADIYCARCCAAWSRRRKHSPVIPFSCILLDYERPNIVASSLVVSDM